MENLAEVELDLIGVIADALGTDEFDLVILNGSPISLVGRILQQRRVLMDYQTRLIESLMNRKFFYLNAKWKCF